MNPESDLQSEINDNPGSFLKALKQCRSIDDLPQLRQIAESRTATDQDAVVGELIRLLSTNQSDPYETHLGRVRLVWQLKNLAPAIFDQLSNTDIPTATLAAAVMSLRPELENLRCQQVSDATFRRYDDSIRRLYQLLAYATNPEDAGRCTELLDSLQEEFVTLIHESKQEYLSHLRSMSAFRAQRHKSERSESMDEESDLIECCAEWLLRKQSGEKDWDEVAERELLAGRREDLLSRLQGAVQLRDGTAPEARFEERDGYHHVQFNPPDPSTWRIEPSSNDSALLRCTTGAKKGALMAARTADIMDAIVSGQLQQLCAVANTTYRQSEQIIRRLREKLTLRDGEYTYDAMDGSRWNVSWNSSIAIRIEAAENSMMYAKLSADEFIDAIQRDRLGLTIRAIKEFYEQNETNRKRLSTFELPISEVRKSGHKVGHIKLYPKSDGEIVDDVSPTMLAPSMYLSAALREKYGEAFDVRPLVFSDSPAESLRKSLEYAYEDGCRSFLIDVYSHGNDREFVFGEAFDADEFLLALRRFHDDHDDCSFCIGTAACFGAGLRLATQRHFHSNANAKRYLRGVFLHVKPDTMNSTASAKPRPGRKREQTATPYMQEFTRLILESNETYGECHNKADSAVSAETNSGLDAEALIDGNLISLAAPDLDTSQLS